MAFARPTADGVEAEVGQRLGLHRLLLGGHDPLEGGVARLVDRVPGGHDRRQRRLERPVAAVGLPLDLRRAALDGELAGAGELRDAQPLGQQRRHDRHLGVGGLRTAEHEVVLQLRQRGGDHRAGLHRARAVDGVVDDVHGLVRAHRQGLADGVGGRVGADGQDGDLAALPVAHQQRLLDGVLVHLVDDVVGRGAGDGVVRRVQLALTARVGDLLDKNDDVHARTFLRGVQDADTGSAWLRSWMLLAGNAAATGRLGDAGHPASRPTPPSRRTGAGCRRAARGRGPGRPPSRRSSRCARTARRRRRAG